MISEKDIEILSHLRKDARKKVTHISREMNLPVTTVYDKIKSHRKKGIVKKHVALLDYGKLGYNANVLLAMKVSRERRDELKEYLTNHPNVNSLYRVNFGHDFMVEGIFENMARMHEFVEDTQTKFNTQDTIIFNIIDEIKKEEFLS
jgi:Lrp/AsnC family transcriptional regulator, leucine-responsive regulatory protein